MKQNLLYIDLNTKEATQAKRLLKSEINNLKLYLQIYKLQFSFFSNNINNFNSKNRKLV